MKKMKFFTFLLLTATLVASGCKEDEEGVVSELDLGLFDTSNQDTMGNDAYYEFFSNNSFNENDVTFKFDDPITVPGTYSVEESDFSMDSFSYKGTKYWEEDEDYTTLSGTMTVTSMGNNVESASFSVKISIWGEIVTIHGTYEEN